MHQGFSQELESWIKSGWHEALQELVPLMAIQQNSGGKVQPVLDFYELNDHVAAFTADNDVCTDQQAQMVPSLSECGHSRPP